MKVKIDVSENIRFVDKDSILGVTTDDGSYKKHICLYPRIKKRIKNYSNKLPYIHSILIYFLIKDDIQNYSSIQICRDASPVKIFNCLRKLFGNNKDWIRLEKNKSIRVKPVGKAYVDKYVRKIRCDKSLHENIINAEQIQDYLLLLENKGKGRT